MTVPNLVFESLSDKPRSRRTAQPKLFVSLLLGLLLLSARHIRAVEPQGIKELDAKRAHRYLVQVCRIGPRPSGSSGMTKQQKLISQHFTKHGAKVGYQSFDAPHPLTGAAVRMNNLIVSWSPAAKQRVLIACHYDTRPFPDQDRKKPRGRFIGANDGASGVALLMELAHHMPDLKPTYGVDFVFFDGEELIYGKQGKYFLGSEHFATEYLRRPPEHKYLYGIVVDMIGDRNLNLYLEKNSLKFAPTLTKSIWKTARDLNISEFIAREKHEIQDDHLPLNQIAGIPTCDIIDFDYRYWHTTRDVASRCSGESLEKVGRVLLTWLEHVPAPDDR